MHCIILLPDAAGRVPTAQELRQRGFSVSAAVELPGVFPASGSAAAAPVLAGGQALAAEDRAVYGGPRQPER